MRISIILFFIISLMSYSVHSQKNRRNAPAANGIVYGNIIAKGEALSYASVALYNKKDSSQINGLITDAKGKFEFQKLKYGTYYLKISFIGFNTSEVNDIAVTPSNSMIKIGDIELNESAEQLTQVEVTSSSSVLEYHIDKKVVNVGKQITAASGSAVDVLQNVPSVQVDITGEVTLRGSSGFMVFIDGRPSVLSGSEALNQIPASTIDKIEIITNPSAKYDPDGTSGIINVITKKNVLEGFSGVVNGNIGLDDKYGGDILLYFRKNKFNYFIGGDYNHRYFPGVSTTDRFTYSNDTTYRTTADGISSRMRTTYKIRGGIEFNAGVRDFFSLNGTIGFREHTNTSELDYMEITYPSTNSNQYLSKNVHSRNGEFYSVSGDYEHKFNNDKHKLSSQLVYNHYQMNEINDNELILPGGILDYGQQSTENGPTFSFRSKIDYSLPIGKNSQFETGIQARLDQSTDTNKVYNLNKATDEYEFQDLFSNVVQYNRDIYSLYGMFNSKNKKLGYQLGLRTEYSDRFIEKIDGDSSTSLTRWDLFPTVHLSYKLPKEHQLMVSYSRRIQRPRGYFFEPFITWVDAFNVRQGNPNLLPEYTDSYELGYSKRVKKTLFSLEAYYRIKHNSIERFRSVYQENVMLSTFQNVGTEYSLGLEGMISIDITKWWNIDLMGNLYSFRGDYITNLINSESTNWSTRVNNTFYLSKTVQFQMNGRYNSASVTAQGRRSDNYVLDAAVKKSFMKKQLFVTLQLSDILQTSRREYESTGVDFKTEEYSRRNSPIVMLNVSYRINNFKAKKTGRGEGDNEGF